MKKAPVSVCLICKNEELQLENCLKSFRDYVEEIIVVDTGSTDRSHEIAKKYADKFEVYLDCNNPETGRIRDFSNARQHSFNLATQPWIMWVDADDELRGAERLPSIIEIAESKREGKPACITFPYEYAHDDKGNPVVRQYRERLVTPASNFEWKNPVHEVMVPKNHDTFNMISEDVVYVHRRAGKVIEPKRNLTILEELYKREGESDARQLYYLGLEYGNVGDFDNMIKFLNRYLQLSGWDDERYMARLRLAQHYMQIADYDKVIDVCLRAITDKETWGEAYFMLAKAHYFLAQSGKDTVRNWQRCAQFAKQGLSFPPTQTLLFVNPLDREYDIHRYLNVALNHLGDIEGAKESAETGLARMPNDEQLASNLRIYKTYLARHAINVRLAEMLNSNLINKNTYDEVISVLDGRQQQVVNEPVASVNIANVNVAEFAKSPTYVKNAHVFVEYGQRPENERPLDIVFFIGNGLEAWTPITVKKNGIGGSETAAIEMSKNLASLGHRVRLFNGCGDAGEGIYDGVEYLKSEKYHDIDCDVLIVSRLANMLDDVYNIKSKIKILWCHDVIAVNATNRLLLKADRILALSNWHKQNLCTVHNLNPEHVIVTRNGINLERFDKQVKRNRFKVVNSSSPDRSWPVLLECWPRIKERVPEAELHLFYGFKNWEIMAAHNPSQAAIIQRLKDKISSLASQGVVFRDRLSQEKLAEEFLSAGVIAYPTWFEETSCQPKGSLIFTKNGMKPIENIVVGDEVLTHKGRFRKVTELKRRHYNGPMYHIKRKKGCRPISLTEGHPLLRTTFHNRSDAKGGRVYNLNNKKVHWASPEELDINLDYLVSPKMEFGNLDKIKISDYTSIFNNNNGILTGNVNCKPVNNEITLNEDFLYILGLFAAEGCVSSAKSRKDRQWYSAVTFAFHKKETDLINAVEKFFGKCSVTPNSENGVCVKFHSSIWVNFLKTIIGTGVDKKIPDFVWSCSKELQLAFLRGMIDGDGSSASNKRGNGNKNYVVNTYTSISHSLAYGASQLLANQGHYPSISFSKLRRAYTLSWMNEPKCSSHKLIDEGYVTRIKEIGVTQYDDTVYNFEVEEDHSYVTDRTVVHNCITMMEAQAAGLRPVTSSIAALNETVADRGVRIDGDWTSPEYQSRFVDEVVAALNREDDSDRAELQKYAKESFGWNTLAVEWQSLFYNLIDNSKDSPIVPYQPLPGFK